MPYEDLKEMDAANPGFPTADMPLDNELYTDPKTGMFFSAAKSGLAEIIADVKALVPS